MNFEYSKHLIKTFVRVTGFEPAEILHPMQAHMPTVEHPVWSGRRGSNPHNHASNARRLPIACTSRN